MKTTQKLYFYLLKALSGTTLIVLLFTTYAVHSDIKIEEINEISEIWIEVKINYQFITKY